MNINKYNSYIHKTRNIYAYYANKRERKDMASKFSEQERAYVHDKLIQYGRTLFGDLGLKKTTIGDLTKRVDIAQGTFYHFFDSKESLYFEILEQEEHNIRKALLDKIKSEDTLNKAALRDLLQQALQFLDESPILQQLFDHTTMEQLLRKLPPEKLNHHNKKDIDFLVPYIEKWQADGVMKQISPDIIVSMFRSLIILSLQKDMIGEASFEATMDQFIKFMADGLIND